MAQGYVGVLKMSTNSRMTISTNPNDFSVTKSITKYVFFFFFFFFFVVAGALEWYFTRYSPLVGVQFLN